jgi:hypothetical protein
MVENRHNRNTPSLGEGDGGWGPSSPTEFIQPRSPASSQSLVDEVLNHRLALVGQDRFWVELHPFNRARNVPQPHDVSVIQAAAGDDEGVGNRVFKDSQRMVSGHLERRFHPLIKPLAVVLDHAGFAVHDAAAAADRGSGNQTDGLMAKADSENGGAGQGAISFHGCLEDFEADSRFLGGAGSGAENDALRGHGLNLFHRDRIVSVDDHVGSQLAQVLNEVEGEAVVVVDDEDHGELGHKIPPRRMMAGEFSLHRGREAFPSAIREILVQRRPIKFVQADSPQLTSLNCWPQ